MTDQFEETAFLAEGPQLLVREIAPAAPYPVDALGPLKSIVMAVQGATQAPVAIPAQSALAVASLAVQGHANVETLGGSCATSIFALTIALSGERKTSVDGRITEGLRLHEREAAAARSEAVLDWINEHALWKADRDRILAEAKRAKGEKRTAAEADLRALGPEPVAPPSTDRIVTEPTFEGLTRLFAVGQPSLGIFSDEGGQFLGGHAMNSDNRQKTLAAMNDLWHGNPIRRTRAGEGHYTLFGRRLAVHLMVQPDVARTFMADGMAAATGFLARFLICEPQSTIGTRFARNTRNDHEAISAFSDRLKNILDAPLPMDPESRELHPRLLPLSKGAREMLSAFSDAVEKEQAPRGDLAHITGTASKAAEQAARIAGVMTLWRNLNAEEASASDMANAIILAQFYLSEASRLANVALVSEETSRAEALRKWLAEAWTDDLVLPSDILQKGPNALRERKALDGPIAMLVKSGHLVPLDEGTVVRGKARKETYRVVRGGDVV